MKMLKHLAFQDMEIVHDNSNSKSYETYNTRLKYEIWAEPEQNQASFDCLECITKNRKQNW